jgi:tetratricopeptide (TPR) repeat protein
MMSKAQPRPVKVDADAGQRLPSYWIFNPLQDTLFLLLTPLAILSAFFLAQRAGWTDALLAFALALAMAHYLPGMLRAYGDRALFRRFRVRLIIAPLFLIATTTWIAYLNLNFVFLLLGLWGAWHWMMQVYGFARIYDAKADTSARTPARLDQMICLLWFGTCVFVLNGALTIYVTRFYESGGPSLPPGAFTWFTRIWFAITVILTGFYLIHTWRTVRARRWPNPLKFVLLIATFAYLYYTASLADQPLMAWAMFESWHDIQYLAIVWVFNLNRARKNPESGLFIRLLFRPRAPLALAYIFLCLAFGALTHAWRLFDDATMMRIVAAFVPAMALLHYYLDGFIWKIREEETRQALGVHSYQQPAPVERPPAWIPAWARHAALWLLLVIPGVLFFLMESKGQAARPLQVYENLVATFPDSAHARHQLGKELMDAGRLREAKVHFERASALNPNLHEVLVKLGILLVDQGDPASARPYFERALKIDPKDAQVHNNLGIVFDELGELEKAKTHLELAVDINPEYALAHNNLGMVLARLGDGARARVHHLRAIGIAPDFADAHYQLGVSLAQEGDLERAARHFEEVLRIDPTQYRAHNNLGAVLRDQGKLAEAKAHFEQALRINPNYASARQNLLELQNRKPEAGSQKPEARMGK